jgi:N utilization substance protein A
VDQEDKHVSVYLRPDQVSLAIGKGGQNIKLAGKLVDMEIDVFRDNEEFGDEDIDLSEFDDEIEEWVISELRRIGLDTAKSVLALSKEELVRRTELEEETVDEVMNILKQEFEE